MNFLITSGGTEEKIDSVRSITNSATGKLGSLIADELAGREETGEIWYVCGKTAIRPQSPRPEILPIGDTAELEDVAGLLAAWAMGGAIIDAVKSARSLGGYPAVDAEWGTRERVDSKRRHGESPGKGRCTE